MGYSRLTLARSTGISHLRNGIGAELRLSALQEKQRKAGTMDPSQQRIWVVLSSTASTFLLEHIPFLAHSTCAYHQQGKRRESELLASLGLHKTQDSCLALCQVPQRNGRAVGNQLDNTTHRLGLATIQASLAIA